MNVTRWFTTVINQPNAKGVLGAVALCSKMAEFDAKKFAEFSGKGAGDKKGKEKAPKAEKKKEPEKKKEKKEEPAGDEIPMEPKKKDPMDALPKGTFDLEEWKRFYSNNDEDPSIAWFWEHFDHENYSIWRGDYKYNDDLTKILPSHGSGSILTMKITPSGEATTSTMMSSPWSSCLAISSAVCSSA